MSNLSVNFSTRSPLFPLQKEAQGVTAKTITSQDVNSSNFSGDIALVGANGQSVRLDIAKYDAGTTPETTLDANGTPVETGHSVADARMALGASVKLPVSPQINVAARANYYGLEVGANKESSLGIDAGVQLNVGDLSASLTQANIISTESAISLEKTLKGNVGYKMGNITALGSVEIESTNTKIGAGLLWEAAPNLSVIGSLSSNGIEAGVDYKINEFGITYQMSMNDMSNQSAVGLSYKF